MDASGRDTASKTLQGIKDGTYFKLVYRRIPAFVTIAMALQLRDAESNNEQLGYPHVLPTDLNVGNTFLFSRPEWEKDYEAISAMVEKNPQFLHRVLESGTELSERLLGMSDEIFSSSFEGESEARLYETFGEFYSEWKKIFSYLDSILNIEKYIESQMREILEAQGCRDGEGALYAMTKPAKKTIDAYERLDMLRIASEYRKGISEGKLGEIVDEHLEKYWFTSFIWGCGFPMKREDLLLRIKGAKEPDAELEQPGKGEVDIEDKELRRWAEIGRGYVWLRTARHQAASFSLTKVNYSLLRELGRGKGAEPWDIVWSYPEELAEGNMQPASVLQARQRFPIFGTLEGEVVKLYGDSAEGLVKEVSRFFFGDAEFAKGIVANKIANISGKAKIVLTADEIGKVEPGDILIAPMTSPSFAPALEKAAAFVTDEGGILCHAAIIGREMGKSCIVGTKNATAIFKDGERVELDVEKGTVKRIE